MPVSGYSQLVTESDSEVHHCLCCGAVSDCVTLPCGHACKCYICQSKRKNASDICPKCTKPVISAPPIFVLE